MSEFGVGEFDPDFEAAVFGLPADGSISKPFRTSYGYHIVKRIKLQPVAATPGEAKEALRTRVEQSDRMNAVKDVLAQKVRTRAGFKKLSFADAELWAYTDSVLHYRSPAIRLTLKPAHSLIKVGEYTGTVADWIAFVQANRYRPDGTGAKPYTQLWDEFVRHTALQYYQDHLEQFNEDFRRQITEFAEGNLFFEIMQQNIWTPAQADVAALENFYQKNKNKYVWKQSADAVLFYSTDAEAAKKFHAVLSNNPLEWKALAAPYAEQVTVDSGRFELAQIIQDNQRKVSEGMVTNPVVSAVDNTTSFAYIIKLHSHEEPRSFADARGLVINDYQAELEKNWLAKLKKKYPVSVNTKVWKELVVKATR